ncbi:MAG: winged helix-turn-helix transcriptional regulator [Myxococcaceae bacterium]|nr:winged helix-turn-helix transcriptional regulator [Myxococcaceae bacterium]
MSAAERLDATFLALADPTRRGVIELLRKSPRRAGELAEVFKVVPPQMSRHLRVLRETGLVDEGPSPDDRRARVYQLRPEPFGELRAWLDEIESFWGGQLEAFRAHTKKSKGAKR